MVFLEDEVEDLLMGGLPELVHLFIQVLKQLLAVSFIV